MKEARIGLVMLTAANCTSWMDWRGVDKDEDVPATRAFAGDWHLAWRWWPPSPEPLIATRGLIDTSPISGSRVLGDKAVRRVSATAQIWFDRTYDASDPRHCETIYLEGEPAGPTPAPVRCFGSVRYSRFDLCARPVGSNRSIFRDGTGQAYAAVVIAEDMLIVSTLVGCPGQAVALTLPQLVDEARDSIAHMNAVNRANRKSPSP